MNKFMFGDKVWHEEYGDGVYGKSSNLKVTTLSQVMFESVGCINILMSELTPATDWVKCSERMPEHGDMVLVFNGNSIEIDALATGEFDFECWCDSVTHWMPLPDAPQEPAND